MITEDELEHICLECFREKTHCHGFCFSMSGALLLLLRDLGTQGLSRV